MCDTMVVTAQATQDGVVIFGKNSDREPNEAQILLQVPAASHPQDSVVQCTYMAIPQVSYTFATLLSKPFWMWGAEMGVNEHGVVIGNEAIFSKAPAGREPKLTGMDLLRLGLERAKTAQQAVTVITSLLEKYGQGGNCGFTHDFYYHNSFLIADPQDAWVLETVGVQWAAKRITGIYTISNCLTIERDWDLASAHLVDFAIEQGWCKNCDEFSFADCYSDFLYTRLSDSRNRCRRSSDLLSVHSGKITTSTIISVLRDHGQGGAHGWSPDHGLTGANICMHAGFGPVRGSQSTGSLVCYLDPAQPLYFATGTSAPCTGIFKPIWGDGTLPANSVETTGVFDEDSLFWRHELLHRATLADYANRIQLYRTERDILEARFIADAFDIQGQPAAERSALTAQCFAEADLAESRWLEMIESQPVKNSPGKLFTRAWRKFNRRAEIPLSIFS